MPRQFLSDFNKRDFNKSNFNKSNFNKQSQPVYRSQRPAGNAIQRLWLWISLEPESPGVVPSLRLGTRGKQSQVVIRACQVLGLAGLLVGTSAVGVWMPVRAAQQGLIGNKFDIPDGGGGRPKRRANAGSRGPCDGTPGEAFGEDALVALVPEFRGQAKTTEEYPTLWFHVPFEMNAVHALQFVLWADGGDDLYDRTPVELTSDVPGAIGITLPPSGPGLVTGQSYTVILEAQCGPDAPDLSSILEFSVTRVERSDTLETALQGAAGPYDQAVAFVNNGIWFEALTLVGDGLRQEPGNELLRDTWTELLGAVELSDVEVGAIANCCSLSQSEPSQLEPSP
ncbi:MAG: DUF928 domain-containing protein [Cyanobacteria bacterium P01_F01_bin.150]